MAASLIGFIASAPMCRALASCFWLNHVANYSWSEHFFSMAEKETF